MRVVETVKEMTSWVSQANRPLGLVPTMGALHEGHLALVRRARQENAATVVSIFVNPTQFGPREDLTSYPRDLNRDLELLKVEGVDLVYAPPVEEVYPEGFNTWVEVAGLADKLEGASRPGHFRGVATVVTKLFTLVRPDRAYFGQKDGQQSVIIRKLERDLNLGVEVVVVPTVRESDGLALSSRNVYLTQEQRHAAPVIYAALRKAEDCWREGSRNGDHLRQIVRETLEAEALVDQIHYVSVADGETLEELQIIEDRAMVSVAVTLGHTRLIDNVILE
ncbi:MAG: pantoate--beta-alanine ligase [Dehalococcoidia bacterium]